MGYWTGIVEQYQPTPGVSQRKDHSEGGFTKLEKPTRRMILPKPGAVREAYCRRVREADRGKEGSEKRRDGGMVDDTERKRKGMWGWKKRWRKRRRK